MDAGSKNTYICSSWIPVSSCVVGVKILPYQFLIIRTALAMVFEQLDEDFNCLQTGDLVAGVLLSSSLNRW